MLVTIVNKHKCGSRAQKFSNGKFPHLATIDRTHSDILYGDNCTHPTVRGCLNGHFVDTRWHLEIENLFTYSRINIHVVDSNHNENKYNVMIASYIYSRITVP